MKNTSGAISNPRLLATLPDILGALSILQSHESDLSVSLAELLSAYEPIEASLNTLRSLGPQLDALSKETRLLDDTVSYTARTAQDVGGRVRSLDEEMKRVREASERVSQIIELKVRTMLSRLVHPLNAATTHAHRQSSLAALHSAMEQQDWESATRHCARAMALPLDVLSGPFAETAVVRACSPALESEALLNDRTAYARDLPSSRADIADCARTFTCRVPTRVRQGFKSPRFGSHQSLLQAIPRNWLGGGGAAGVRRLCGRTGQSTGTGFREECVHVLPSKSMSHRLQLRHPCTT